VVVIVEGEVVGHFEDGVVVGQVMSEVLSSQDVVWLATGVSSSGPYVGADELGHQRGACVPLRPPPANQSRRRHSGALERNPGAPPCHLTRFQSMGHSPTPCKRFILSYGLSWVNPITHSVRDSPTPTGLLRYYIVRPSSISWSFWSVPGGRPPPQVLTLFVSHMTKSFALPRLGKGTQGWAFSASPAYQFLNLSSPYMLSASI
jgi:hypothetical protein